MDLRRGALAWTQAPQAWLTAPALATSGASGLRPRSRALRPWAQVGRRRKPAEGSLRRSRRACQQLLNAAWMELAEPTVPSITRWLEEGCVSLVRRLLLKLGWQVTTEGCDGAGFHSKDGALWCFLQEEAPEVVDRPELAEEYDPAKDALFLACVRTLGANAARVTSFLVSQRNGTRAKERNEWLTGQACMQAACCER